MLKVKWANKMVKRICIFIMVFAIAGVVMSSNLLHISDSLLHMYAVQSVFLPKEPEPDPDIGKSVDLWSQLSESQEAFVTDVRNNDDPDNKQVGIFLFADQADNLDLNNFVYSSDIPLSVELQQYTYDSCSKRGLEYELVLAIMWRESRFQTAAVNVNTNGTFDSGIMQINDINKQWLRTEYGIDNLMDPYQNITAGTIMLENFTEKYELNQALMAYQYGESGMLKKVNQGIDTNSMVRVALEKRDYYRQLIQSA